MGVTMKFDELTMRIAVSLRDYRRLRPRELSIPMPLGQIDTLDAIARNGPCTMVELADALRIDASTATRAVEPLVRNHLVERRRSDRDARAVIVELSREGRRVERQLTIERFESLEASLDSFTREEREMFADFLERLMQGALAAQTDAGPTTSR
jgi:DNA-binding MarR family transcriptional regulator